MAKWTRVGDIPNKIPVNFVVDSKQYPELAAWIYAFPHGEMGKTVREILNVHAKKSASGQFRPASDSQNTAPSADRVAVQSPHASTRPDVPPDSEADQAPSVMDEATRRTLLRVDQDS